MSVKRRYEKMTDEDKAFLRVIDFEMMQDEMEDMMIKFTNITTGENPDIESVAIIDAAMATAHDALSEGDKLLDERKAKEG